MADVNGEGMTYKQMAVLLGLIGSMHVSVGLPLIHYAVNPLVEDALREHVEGGVHKGAVTEKSLDKVLKPLFQRLDRIDRKLEHLPRVRPAAAK